MQYSEASLFSSDYQTSISLRSILNMASTEPNLKRLIRNKRGCLNFGGSENNPDINGSQNIVHIGINPATLGQETLLRKAGNEVGRVLKGGADLAVAPANWINHMQDNWLFRVLNPASYKCEAVFSETKIRTTIIINCRSSMKSNCIRSRISIVGSGNTVYVQDSNNNSEIGCFFLVPESYSIIITIIIITCAIVGCACCFNYFFRRFFHHHTTKYTLSAVTDNLKDENCSQLNLRI